jgi:initiation factor 1A
MSLKKLLLIKHVKYNKYLVCKNKIEIYLKNSCNNNNTYRMVKNTHGGSGHKKFARKNTSVSKSNKLRVAENDGEIYAIATKMLGNNMFHCHCIDGILRLGNIRGKFTGRGKRDNMVEGGKWVLVGLREWDVPSEKSSSISKGKCKIQQCDLLEVYTDLDKHKLKDTISENWAMLESNDVSKINLGTSQTEDDFVFGTDMDFEREKIIQEMKSATTEKIKLQVEDSDAIEDTINIDEI